MILSILFILMAKRLSNVHMTVEIQLAIRILQFYFPILK